MSAITNDGSNGITAQAANAVSSDSTGASRNSSQLALAGTMTSLSSILITSAKGCSTPFQPTRWGPSRFWMKPMILRSA